MNKPTIAVIFGSRSTEHDVSIVTAIASIIKPLDLSNEYNVVPVYIAKDGRWYSEPELKDISLFSNGKIDDFIVAHKPISVQLGQGLTLIKPGVRAREIKIDIAFPATHGTHGEDGELMALLELANIPYIGCNVPASVLAMDKVLAKIVCGSQKIPTSRYVWFRAVDYTSDQVGNLKKIDGLNYPLFVKPPHLGSSIGITRVKDKQELLNAIEVAAHYDDKILVEEAVGNLIEVTVPVMGNDTPRTALVEQPLTNNEEFFDFETKYIHGGGKKAGTGKAGAQGYSKLPADIPEKLYKVCEQTAIAVYQALGCCGTARVDLLIDSQTEVVYFNEVNPLPGSLYAHNWRAAGVSGIELVKDLIGYAQERFEQKQRQETVFTTSFLKQF